MMYSFVSNIDKKEYDRFIENYSMPSFMQEYNWANIKNNWGNFHCGLYKEKELVGVCTILVKKIFKNIKLFYIPRGYLIDFTNFDDLKAMTDNIRKLAKENRAYVVKIDPNFCISDNSFKEEDVEHIYSKDYEIKHRNLLKLGYKWLGISKKLHKTFQPQYNIFAPIINNKLEFLTEEEVLKTYKSKFKYYLGDFHLKRGVTFNISNDIKDLDKFIHLLEITEKKQNIILRDKSYFERIFDNFNDRAFIFFGNVDLRKYYDFLKNNNAKDEEINEITKLMEINGDEITLSTGLLLLPGNRKGIRTSEYLYAGNDLILEKLNISQGLVFEMIKFSIKNNCFYVNLGGVDGNLNDNLTVFKRKFNGRIMEFAGEYDLPISKIYYPIKYLYPILIRIYRKLK